MANSDYLTTPLLATIKRRTFMPSAQIAFTDTELLAMADEELRTYIVPFLRGINEEHLLYKQTYTLDGVVSSFLLPAGATGEAVRSVEITNSNGDYIPWQRIEPGQEQKTRTGFYVDDERLVVASVPPPIGTMRVRYWRRPGKLISDTTRYVVPSVTPTGNSVQGPYLASPVLSSGAAQLVEAGPGFRTLFTSTISSALPNIGNTATIYIFADTMPATQDYSNCYLCFGDESPVPQVPWECQPLLAQRVACAVIEHRGAPNLQSAREELERIRAAVTVLMSQRTQSQQRHVQNFFGPGWKRFRARRLLP